MSELKTEVERVTAAWLRETTGRADKSSVEKTPGGIAILVLQNFSAPTEGSLICQTNMHFHTPNRHFSCCIVVDCSPIFSAPVGRAAWGIVGYISRFVSVETPSSVADDGRQYNQQKRSHPYCPEFRPNPRRKGGGVCSTLAQRTNHCCKNKEFRVGSPCSPEATVASLPEER